jgi:pimeloyl-ACP methyl ester carboxylesterase
MLRWFEHSQVFHPDRVLVNNGSELKRRFEDVWLKTADGININAWFYPATPNSPRSDHAILICHGNAGNISHRLELCSALLEAGVSVLLFDYRGYGKSKGRPSEAGTYLDAEAAYDWLLRQGFSSPHIVAYGESLGGAVATELALRRPVGGLVLESSFSCTADIGAELFPWLPVRWLNSIKYDTCSKLPRLKIPLLVLHSRDDQLIGFHHAEKNFSRANEPKIFCEITGDHCEPLADRTKFLEAILKLLELLKRSQKQIKV